MLSRAGLGAPVGISPREPKWPETVPQPDRSLPTFKNIKQLKKKLIRCAETHIHYVANKMFSYKPPYRTQLYRSIIRHAS